jgi:hypothetical protein
LISKKILAKKGVIMIFIEDSRLLDFLTLFLSSRLFYTLLI